MDFKNIPISVAIKKYKREINILINQKENLLMYKNLFYKNFLGKKSKLEYVSSIYLIKLDRNKIKKLN